MEEFLQVCALQEDAIASWRLYRKWHRPVVIRRRVGEEAVDQWP
jgi:hypothetical protein